jgi:predicted small metal-binding protein
MATTVFDCARVPDSKCSVKIVGERDDVVRAAHDHLVATHGMPAGNDLKDKVNGAVDEHQMRYGTWAH